MIKTDGLVHFSIPVIDLEESGKFYKELLGMEEIHRVPGLMLFLKCGNDHLVLCTAPKQAAPSMEDPGIVHHAFDVACEEYDHAKEKLNAQGVTVLRDEYRDDGVFNGRSMYFRDPSGNVLELIDRTEFGRRVGVNPKRMTRL